MSVTTAKGNYQDAGLFVTSLDHVLGELERIDWVVRLRLSQVKEWVNEEKDFRGLYISENEVNEILQKPIGFSDPDQRDFPAFSNAAEEKIKEISQNNARRRQESIRAGINLRLLHIQEKFDFCEFEMDVLLLGLAAEINQQYERIFGYLHDDITKKTSKCPNDAQSFLSNA